ncbi:MAG: S-methyl-5'-thioadenosine phosphorylase [Anaerolineae bacterium]|nr:S-methyl-5'-thioadenosine phosphorylase [Anaerolineae bacterium]
MKPVPNAVIGGSGLYQLEGLSNVQEMDIDTPFGKPSDAIIVGELKGIRVAFLPRHGRGHRISPTELPVRANIYALKSLGVKRIIASSACGSLRENIVPRHIVIPDQLYDRTRHRTPHTFFEGGIVAHIGFADPFCPTLRQILLDGAQAAGATVHDGGTMVVIEGPQFSTRAESNTYRKLGFDTIGMTALPEAKLAREAEICYASMNLVTDYDVWYPEHDEVTVEMVIGNMMANLETAKSIIRYALPRMEAIGGDAHCACPDALAGAIITNLQVIPKEKKKQLELLIEKYVEC